MTNPTSNYNFQMPTATDLVTDLPADFEVFGQAVDSSMADLKGGTTGQVLAKASNADMDFVWSADAAGMTNPMTTTGDTIYSSSGSTPARLGIGSTGQVLTVSSGLPTWAAASAPAQAWINISTTTTNTGSSYTITGLSGYKSLRIFFNGISQNGTTAPFLRVQFNSDTGSNYSQFGSEIQGGTTDDYNKVASDTYLTFGRQSTTASDEVVGYLTVDGCAGTDDKIGLIMSGASGTTSKRSIRSGFRYNASAAISSITVFWSAGSFDTGTIDIWGSVN